MKMLEGHLAWWSTPTLFCLDILENTFLLTFCATLHITLDACGWNNNCLVERWGGGTVCTLVQSRVVGRWLVRCDGGTGESGRLSAGPSPLLPSQRQQTSSGSNLPRSLVTSRLCWNFHLPCPDLVSGGEKPASSACTEWEINRTDGMIYKLENSR